MVHLTQEVIACRWQGFPSRYSMLIYYSSISRWPWQLVLYQPTTGAYVVLIGLDTASMLHIALNYVLLLDAVQMAEANVLNLSCTPWPPTHCAYFSIVAFCLQLGGSHGTWPPVPSSRRSSSCNSHAGSDALTQLAFWQEYVLPQWPSMHHSPYVVRMWKKFGFVFISA